MVVVEAVLCPGCDQPVLPCSTVCGECGQRLVPPLPFVDEPARVEPHCTCGGSSLCVHCVIDAYDEGRMP